MNVGGVGNAHRCPRCGSDDTAALSAIWEHGTSRAVGLAVGDDAHGHSWSGLVGGTSASEAARRAAPPQRRSNVVPLLIGLASLIVAMCSGLGGLFGLVDAHGIRDVGIALVMLALLAVSLVVGNKAFGAYFAASRRESLEFSARRGEWSEAWSCRRCGTRFTPARDQASMSASRSPVSARAPTSPTVSVSCENCDRPIGRLETPHVWLDHVVCGRCHSDLSVQPGAPRSAGADDGAPTTHHEGHV
jgi:hypothetical protein